MNAADEIVVNERLARLEVIADYTTKTLESLQRRMDDGFKEQRTDFRWMLGIQITTFVAVIGLIAKSAKLF